MLKALLAPLFLATPVLAQPAPPAIVQQPADAVTNAGGAAAFQVVATGTDPLIYQWTRDNQPIAGATHAVLVIETATADHAGLYRARVSSSANARASIETREARLTVMPPPAAPIVDPTFRGDPRLNATPSAVLPLPNGEVIVAPGIDRSIVRLHPDGSLDPKFASGTFEPRFGSAPSELRFSELVAQPDGRLLVTGTFASIDGVTVNGLVRLNPDGTRDLSFAPPADFPVFDTTSSTPPRRVALQSDGKILLLSKRGLVRLLANGQLDAGFSSALTANNNVATFAVTGDDRIYVALYREQVVARLLPHGGEDPSFTRQPLHVSPLTQLHVLPDGRLIVVGSQIFPTRPVSQFFYSLTR